jgi:hypothetical protein
VCNKVTVGYGKKDYQKLKTRAGTPYYISTEVLM